MIYENVGQLIKGQRLRSISEDNNIYDACSVLDQFNVGALAVLRDGDLVGIFSERDVVRRVVMQGRDFIKTTVAGVMTPNPQVVDVSAGLAEALSMMIKGHFRHLPVLQDGTAVGMISIRNIPVDYWYMKERYEEMLATPAADAEAAVNQHRQTETDTNIGGAPSFSAGVL